MRYRKLALALLAAFLFACSSREASTAAHDDGQSCAEIEHACHLPLGGLVLECHAVGHRLDEARCTAQRSACLAECGAARATLTASSGGSGGSSGGGGSAETPNSGDAQGGSVAASGGAAAGSNAGPGGSAGSAGSGEPSTSGGNSSSVPDPLLTCELQCACLVDTCAAQVGYPFADTQACLTTCERDLSPKLKCFHSFCTFAAQLEGDDRQHNCEHAWGGLGLAECF